MREQAFDNTAARRQRELELALAYLFGPAITAQQIALDVAQALMGALGASSRPLFPDESRLAEEASPTRQPHAQAPQSSAPARRPAGRFRRLDTSGAAASAP